MRVIGTAGHVDHGKSTLVRRLTGMDPDRLAEEKARQLTIDLGFAWLALDYGETVGIVDVPGHRDFIENMLAGVGGIDAVLLVIAADEGVMPQTREHLAILDLLDIQHGLIVLTKTDLVKDPDWLELVEQDVREVLLGTALEHAGVVQVSALDDKGISMLKAKINTLLAGLPARTDVDKPRLWIDRVFTVSGFGTVVTGTLQDGKLRIGDEIAIQPSDLRGRIRGLQSYKQSVDTAYPGSRVAVNITGIEKNDVARGQLLASPGQVTPTTLADVFFRHLSDAGRPLKHNAQVKVFCGSAESLAHVRLLDSERLEPGAEGWVQLRLDTRLPLSRNDRLVIRYPSPPQTIGGGIVVDANPVRRWRRFQPNVINRLAITLEGTPADRVLQVLNGREPLKYTDLQKQIDLNESELQAGLREALENHAALELGNGLYISVSSYNALQQDIVNAVTEFHRSEPLRLGMPREELRSRLGLKGATLNLLLSRQEDIIINSNLLKLSQHNVSFNRQQQASVDKLMHQMHADPYTPPSYTEALSVVGPDVLRALIELGEIVQVQPEVIFARDGYEKMVSGVLGLLDERGEIDTGAVRDHFNTSRKYAIGLLEHLDSVGITRRLGDNRVHGPKAGTSR